MVLVLDFDPGRSAEVLSAIPTLKTTDKKPADA